MKRAIWRLYLNFEKEEKWLNEMATAGWMLTDYSWCRYVFEEGREGEYVYRIELLKNLPTYPLSQKYLRFLEEAGIEYVAYYARWVYLRKKPPTVRSTSIPIWSRRSRTTDASCATGACSQGSK